MINLIWAAMILVGIITALLTGHMEDVNAGIIDAGSDAVSLCITMLGIVTMWCGIMKIAERTGLMKKWSSKMSPVMKFLFPRLSPEHPAYEYMCTNIIANIVGLGWAATPPALKAMQELAKDNKGSKSASREMCVFLILNISSLQLIPVNIIAYRATYGSEHPTAIILPGIFAPFSVFLLTKNMRRIPKSYIEAAQLDGAGEWQIFSRVCLPMCKSALVSVAMLVFIDYWNMVEQPLILFTDQEKYPLSVFLSEINSGEVGVAFAVAVIYMVPTLLMFLWGEEYLEEGITYSGGIKG